MDISYIQGDIFAMKADSLVFPANHKPVIGGSLDGQIYERAGMEQLLHQRKKHGELHSGESCITESCDLTNNYRWLIHTATPVYQPSHPTNTMHKLKKCYLSALELSDKKGLKHIVFVLLGAGASGFSHSKAKEAADSAIKRYCSEHPDSLIESVTIVEYEKESQYQLLIQCNRKLIELKAMLSQIEELKDYVQIDSYMGEIRTTIAKHLKSYADEETVRIKQAYQREITRLSAETTELSAEDRLYKSIVKLPNGINQTAFAERIYLQESSNISQIVNLYSKNGKQYANAFSFFNSKLNVIKLGLGLELSFDKMCWLMWSRGHEFPISELDIDLSECYIKQGKCLDALVDYEEEFNNQYGITKSNEKDL